MMEDIDVHLVLRHESIAAEGPIFLVRIYIVLVADCVATRIVHSGRIITLQ